MYLSRNNDRHGRWHTDTEESDREGKTCCPSHCTMKTHRSGCPQYESKDM